MNACMPPSLSTQPFGGMNIVFCGCPAAQLAPVCTLPICAYYGDTAPRTACFYRFRTIVEPTNHSARQAMTTPKFALAPFGQAVPRELRTCTLTHASTSLPPTTSANASTTNASSPPSLPCKSMTATLMFAHATETTTTTAIALTTTTQLATVGAEAVLAFNLWTEAALVNKATTCCEHWRPRISHRSLETLLRPGTTNASQTSNLSGSRPRHR